MFNEEIDQKADEYLDRFLGSDLSMILIKDDVFPQNEMCKGLQNRISERGINNLTAYTFMGSLYLEKK